MAPLIIGAILSLAIAVECSVPQKPLQPQDSSPQQSYGADFQNDSKWPMQKYHTESFIAPDLSINKSEGTAPGYLFFAPTGSDAATVAPLIMTDDNELVWHLDEPHDPDKSKNNFKVQTINGTPYLTWWDGTMIHTFGHGYGKIRILDATYKEVYTFCPDMETVTTDGASYPCYLDMHENYVTDRGSIIVSAYNVTQTDLRSVGGPKEGWVWDSLFFEYDIVSKKELFRWSSLEHLKDIPLKDCKYPLSVKGREFGKNRSEPWDYFHINSVQPMDNGYLVNGRHTWAFYKVDLVGNVEWQVEGEHGGDFTFDKAASFSWQHEPRVSHKTSTGYYIHLYNNANSEGSNVTKPTSGLLLDVDVENSQISMLRDLQDPEDPVYSASQGSYQELPEDHVLLGYGQDAKIREFNSAGDSIFTAQFGPVGEGIHEASYRAFRFEWEGKPTSKPKLVAKQDGSRTRLYMSWNGATGIESWMVYLTNSKHDDAPDAQLVQKAGFETTHTVNYVPKYVQVEAIRGGHVLGSSDIVRVGS